MRRLINWTWIVIGTFLGLVTTLQYHFERLSGSSAILGGLTSVLAFGAGIFLLKKSRDETEVFSGDSGFATPAEVWREIERLLEVIRILPSTSDETQEVIDDPIRTTYNKIARWLADHPGFIGYRQVEVQMALGDVMNAVERVWTTLADGHPNAAREAYEEALAHVERVGHLIEMAPVTPTGTSHGHGPIYFAN